MYYGSMNVEIERNDPVPVPRKKTKKKSVKKKRKGIKKIKSTGVGGVVKTKKKKKRLKKKGVTNSSTHSAETKTAKERK